MTNQQLATWVEAAYSAMAPFYATRRNPQGWPQPGKSGQGAATAWAWGIFAQAASDVIGTAGGGHELRVAWGHAKHRAAKAEMLRKFWGNAPARAHVHHELVADLTALDWSHQQPVRASGESEVYAWHGVGRTPDHANGYAKDFMKLLLLPSPRRVFIARVGPDEHDWGSDRRTALLANLSHLILTYSQLLGHADELGVVLIPEEGGGEGANTWRDLRTGVWVGDHFDENLPWMRS